MRGETTHLLAIPEKLRKQPQLVGLQRSVFEVRDL
jgi:hypothetical protein